MKDPGTKPVVAGVPPTIEGQAKLAIEMYRRIMGKDPEPEDLARIQQLVDASKKQPDNR